MEQLKQFAGNATLMPSPLDLFLAVPRLAHRAGAFFARFDYLSDLNQTGSVIADRTATDILNSTSTSLLRLVQNTVTATNTGSSDSHGSGDLNIYYLHSIRQWGGIFSYLLSRWVLATLITAIVLNRTQFFASSRRPITVNWHARFAIYSIPIAIFVWQVQRTLQALRCQTSPNWGNIQYGNGSYSLPFDYAAEGGMLYNLSSRVLFWEQEVASCASVNMLPSAPGVVRSSGSIGLLWPIFWSLGISQFVETLVCALQGERAMPETGMTIFEHSLAFSEAEAAITKPLSMFSSQSSKSTPLKSSVVTSHGVGFAHTTLLQVANVPPEVLVISLISSLSHLCGNVLAVLGLRKRFRLINTTVWGLSYMAIFIWSFLRAINAPEDVLTDGGILRYPTVCIIGFIPHLLLSMGIIICTAIYGLALVLTAASLPLGDDDDKSILSRLSLAHQNLQANTHLTSATGININWQEDFYTVLLKVGFTVLTAASEAVYLHEDSHVAIYPATWLEESRIRELIAEKKGLKRALDTIPSDFTEGSDDTLGAQASTVDNLGSSSGYDRERKVKKQQANARDADRIEGIGVRQRRSRWQMALQFFKGIFWLQVGLYARLTLFTLSFLRVPYRPRWLTSLFGRDERNNRKSMSRGLMLRREPDFSDVDSSGDFAVVETDDDLTSVISTSEDGDEMIDGDDDDDDDGQKTPTRAGTWSFGRATSPADDLFEPQQLATLLDPQTPEQRDEARLLAMRLRSDTIVTRSQHRKMLQQDRTKILSTSSQFPKGRMTPEQEEEALERFLLDRRKTRDAFRAQATGETGSWASGAAGMGSGGPQCVVCQSCPRTILMWPCSCLALCDDCRIGLATRNFTACVCCRSTVVAYSRMYVP